MTMTMTFSVFLDDEEYVIQGTYTPEDPGQTSGPPERCYEGSPSEFEMLSIKLNGTECGRLSQEIYDKLQCLADVKADEEYALFCEAEAAAYAEYRDSDSYEGP